MTARLIPFLRRRVVVSDWTQAELAEFYRVEASLLAAGMRVEADRGVTDEGEPWFVFCHADGEQDVIIHFARLGGSYLVGTPSLGRDVGNSETGDDFRALVQRLLAQHDAIAAQRRAGEGKGNVVLHPAAMLWVLVALAFLKSSDARAFDGANHNGAPGSATPGAAHTGSTQVGPGEDAAAQQAGRGTPAADPLTMLAGYALQSVMIAWASTLGPLSAETHLASRQGALESWLGKEPPADPFIATVTITAAPAPEDSGHAGPGTPAAGPTGAGSVTETATDAVPVWHASDITPGHTTVAPVPDMAVQAAGVHAMPEPLPTQAIIDLQAPMPIPEAQQVLAAAGAGDLLKDASIVAAPPDAIATVLDHAAHLSGAAADTAAEQAVLQAEATLAAAAAPTASDAAPIVTQDATAHTSIATPATIGATAASTGTDADAHAATGSSATGATGHATDGASVTTASAPLTTPAVTTAALTTPAVTTPALTTSAATTADATHDTTVAPAQAADATPAVAPASTPIAPPASVSTAATDPAAHPTSTALVVPTPVSATTLQETTAPPPAALDQQKIALATSAVHEFLSEIPQAQTMLVQNTLVVYDPAAISDLAHVQAITFDFSDNSHISLIGLPSELAYALAGHA